MAEENNQEYTKEESIAIAWARIISRAWEDAEFEADLKENPKSVMRALGLKFSSLAKSGDDVNIKVIDEEDSSTSQLFSYDKENDVLTFYLPKKPEGMNELGFSQKYVGFGT